MFAKNTPGDMKFINQKSILQYFTAISLGQDHWLKC